MKNSVSATELDRIFNESSYFLGKIILLEDETMKGSM